MWPSLPAVAIQFRTFQIEAMASPELLGYGHEGRVFCKCRFRDLPEEGFVKALKLRKKLKRKRGLPTPEVRDPDHRWLKTVE